MEATYPHTDSRVGRKNYEEKSHQEVDVRHLLPFILQDQYPLPEKEPPSVLGTPRDLQSINPDDDREWLAIIEDQSSRLYSYEQAHRAKQFILEQERILNAFEAKKV